MSKSIKLKNILLLAVAVSIMVSAIFNVKIVYANGSESVFKIIVEDKIYTFNSYEISNTNGKKSLKKAEEIVDGIYLDTLIKPRNATILFTEKKINL